MGIRRRLTILYYSYKVAKKAKVATGKVYCTHKTTVSKETSLGDNVNFNGAEISGNVSIVGNLTIGKNAIIQAGSVVTSDIPALAIAGENPAKVFKSLDC